MHFLKIFWRGVRDVYDQFVYFMMLSFAWVACAVPAAVGYTFLAVSPLFFPVTLFTTLLIPPATLTLYALTDPRRIVSRPDFKEITHIFAESFLRSWKIAIVTVPFLVILLWNATFFGGTDTVLAAMVPLWLVMFVFLFILTMYMFSLGGMMESGPRNAFRGGMYVLVSRPFVSMFLSLAIMALAVLFTVSVLPMLTIGPPLFAAVVNRMVLTELEVPVIDPNAPTDERQWERERGLNLETSIWDRLKRGGKTR